MCGIAGILGDNWKREQLDAMVSCQRHRGPDTDDVYIDLSKGVGLGHNRLSILDLSDSGNQPMRDNSGRYFILFNGEIYNYIELRNELNGKYDFRSTGDTEVLLACYIEYGRDCLDKLIGMFAFAVWDSKEKTLFAARDRFGVKPFYYHQSEGGTFFFASEIKTLHAGGVPAQKDPITWASYLSDGVGDFPDRTFWQGILPLPAGHEMTWQNGKTSIRRWYHFPVSPDEPFDAHPEEEVMEEYLQLLKESIRIRFRSDVPVGINLSGGLDSSILLGLVQAVQGEDSEVKAFTFVTGDDAYDELPWTRQMVAHTRHPLVTCKLSVDDVPAEAERIQYFQDEPFGGIPTLAYARIFQVARSEGVIVLLDGQGMDEQWAGYDYYVNAQKGADKLVQGTKSSPVRPECLVPEFRGQKQTLSPFAPYKDALRNLQFRDSFYTKIPRVLRYNDRISMASSTELREPFLDHRLFEIAFRQPPERKISNNVTKLFLRKTARHLLPEKVVNAPKRPLQTPQREWLKGPLRDWANQCIDDALKKYDGIWLDGKRVRDEWRLYQNSDIDNSFYIWQWISLGLPETRFAR